jgi:tRNA G10  N-methylase Trm11
VALLLRIILSSTSPGDTILDPFAGTGTTLVVAEQLKRNSVGIEIDPKYVKLIEERLECIGKTDDVSKFYDYYRFTPKIEEIWPVDKSLSFAKQKQKRLF